MAVISINYNDGTGEGYDGVEIYTDDSVKIPFNTGDFVKDWYDCMRYILTGQLTVSFALIFSSSVHHFISDTDDKYKSVYLSPTDEKKEIWEITDNYSEDGFEFFVESDWNGTWKELKEKYDDKDKGTEKTT